MFFEIQSAELEADDRPIEVAAQPPRSNQSRRQSNSTSSSSIIISNHGGVLDQIKRSAGSTPAFKSSERGSKSIINHHQHIHDFDPHDNYDDEDLDSTIIFDEVDALRKNDTDNGYAGFSVTPFATTNNSDFKFLPKYSLRTATTADESSYSLQNQTSEFTSFFFDHDNIDDECNNENDDAAVESDKKSYVSTNSSRTMNFFTSMHNSTKPNKQPPPPPSSIASSSTKRFSPFKNITGTAERMLRLLDAPNIQQPTQSLQQQEQPRQKSLVTESHGNANVHHSIPLWYIDDDKNGGATDDDEDEDGRFGEPISLLDVDDNDDEYVDEEGDDDDQTYSDSYTQTYTNNYDDDDESYYDSDDYDDDETFLTMEDEYDEHDENGAKLPESMMVTGVESFLDELADVEDVRDLGTLLYQVGSCNFQGITNSTTSNRMADNEDDDDEYTVTSDAFPNMKQSIHSYPMVQSNTSVPTQQQPASFSLWPHKQNTKQSTSIPEDSRGPLLKGSGSNGNNGTSGQSFIEETTDTVAHILHSMSISTESLYDIMGASSNISQPSASARLQHSPNSKNVTKVATPNNANLSFFQSIFSCHG